MEKDTLKELAHISEGLRFIGLSLTEHVSRLMNVADDLTSEVLTTLTEGEMEEVRDVLDLRDELESAKLDILGVAMNLAEKVKAHAED